MKIKKTKITKADKNLIRDTVKSVAAMRLNNIEIEDEEMDGLIRSNGGSNNSRGQQRSNDGFWKALAFCMFGILVLFLTDTVEFKKMKSVDHNGMVDDDEGMDVIFAGHVEIKPPRSPTSPPVPAPTEDPTAKPTDQEVTVTADLTAKPTEKAPDPTANPTEKAPDPTANPTAKAVEPAPEPVTSPTPAVSVGVSTRHTYQTRGQPMSDEDRKAMESKWGKWSLEADKKDRPTDDYYAAYPNRDVPYDKFPSNAWQKDKEWLSKFLPEGIQLVDRAINAILEEYGEPTDGTSNLFHIERYENFEGDIKMDKEDCAKQVGCTTHKSMENLKRRLLHAVMTEDNFIFATAGHSSTAGHGNHFTQSFTLQVQWILEGVFARLGVRHQSRNIALGGLGTVQTGVATKQIMGHDVDFMHWDSGMTEKEAEARDMLFRQGILGPGKVPMISSATSRYDVLNFLNKRADADIAMIGDQGNLDKTETLEEVAKLPWAKQYVNCGPEISKICRGEEYFGRCWIDRDDFTPSTKQDSEPGGRASWHPGNRIHQKKGRAIAYMILVALKDALTEWNDAKDYQLADDAWHVTSLYDNTRSKVEKIDPEDGHCYKYGKGFSSIMCNTAIKARTEFTPRAYPDDSNIRTLLPPSQKEYINDPPETIYEAPEAFNPDLHPPEGALDVLNIIEAGPAYTSVNVPDYTQFYSKPKFAKEPSQPVGKGYYLNTYAGFCDGSVDSWCKRQEGEKCLMNGHNDGRNGIRMDAYCGWMVMNLPEFKHGFIALKIETWHQPKSNPKTKDWKSINNERRTLAERAEEPFLRSSTRLELHETDLERQLKPKVPDYCDKFKFEFSIDGGKVVEWNKDKFLENMGHLQRVVEVLKVAEDPSITNGEEREIEIAFRMTGCFEKQMHLTHVYWA